MAKLVLINGSPSAQSRTGRLLDHFATELERDGWRATELVLALEDVARRGMAMGAAGTAAALETADVAIMDDDPRKAAAFIRLGRRTVAVLRQNITLALGIKALFMALALTGQATLWMAVFADVGASLLVVGNGLRLLRQREIARR